MAGGTTGTAVAAPRGGSRARTAARATDGGVDESSTWTRPHSRCRGSTSGCANAFAAAIASSRTRSR